MDISDIDAMLSRFDKPDLIAEAIETIPKEERPSRHAIFLTRYYYKKACAEQDPFLWKKGLNSVLDETLNPHLEPEVAYLRAVGYFYSAILSDAKISAHVASFYAPVHAAECDAIFAHCDELMAWPRFPATFRKRVEQFWPYFRKMENKTCQMIDRAAGTDKDSPECQALWEHSEDVYYRVLDELHIDQGTRPDGGYHCLFRTVGHEELSFLYDYILRHKPALKHPWTWVEPSPQKVTSLDGLFTIGLNIWLEGQPDGRVSLILASESSMKPRRGRRSHKNPFESFANALENLTPEVVRRRINEPTLIGSIREIKIISSDFPDRPADTDVDGLEEELKRRNLYYESWRDLAEKRVLSWRALVDKNHPETVELRRDAISITTRIRSLGDEFVEGKTRTMDSLVMEGVAAGFLYFPIEDLSDISFRTVLEDALRSAGEDCVLLLGHTEGWMHQYIDFLAWDFEAVMSRLLRTLSNIGEIPVEWIRFHTFYADARPIELYPEPDPITKTSLRPLFEVPYQDVPIPGPPERPTPIHTIRTKRRPTGGTISRKKKGRK